MSDKIKTSFEESELFKLVANYPDNLAKAVIENCGDLSDDQKEHITAGFMKLGFHMIVAASASWRLQHATDLMRNQGSIGPDIRYLILESSAELNNAVLFKEPIMLCESFLTKYGEDFDNWSTEVPPDLPDDGIKIKYVRNFNTVADGKLIYFRYQDFEQNIVITDIPCIYDTELMAYMPLINNPVWKYIREPIVDNTEEKSEGTESVTQSDGKEDQGPEGN